MHALIVISHPDPASLTHRIAARVGEGIRSTKEGASAEVVDLDAEGFSPQFTRQDLAVHRFKRAASDDVLREQRRIDGADALVLVYPVYWWSFPALLKGWIDRVFSNGWAYDEAPGQPLIKKLHHLPVHLVAIGGAGLKTYARHGYFGAMRTQIDHGIFDYCGARVVTTELLLPQGDVEATLDRAYDLGRRLFDIAEAGRPAA